MSADNNPKTRYGDMKPPVHLVPPIAILQEAMVFKLGAHKYGPYNWRDNKVAVSVYYSAAMRHLTSFWDGENLDPQSQESHLAHARASLAILIDALSSGNLIDDRPPPGQAAQFIAAVESRKPTLEITTDATTTGQPH